MRKGLCLHSLRHIADTIANSAKGANVVNTALMMGYKAINMENTYTHATEEALATIVTSSWNEIRLPPLQVVSDKKFFLVGVQSPSKIKPPADGRGAQMKNVVRARRAPRRKNARGRS